jgi:hypothetical protein
MRKIYDLYVESSRSSNCLPVSLSVYRNIFLTNNLRFKKPQMDTCKTCDIMDIQIKATMDEMHKNSLIEKQIEHQTTADFHYGSKRRDKDVASGSNEKVVVAVFDLQKCLETPHITSSIAFYKRKLWTFNLIVRNCNTHKTSCFMWHKGTAKRWANEIASCLYKLPEPTENLILYSSIHVLAKTEIQFYQ